MVLIFDETGVPGAHDALMQKLREAGARFYLRSARHYRGPEEGVEVVYTDSDAIAADYPDADVRPLNWLEAVDEEAQKIHTLLSDAENQTGLERRGGGWWDVIIDGEAVDRVQGKKAAQQRLSELIQPNNDTD
jgi:predicted RNA-binding protein with PIN domain